MANRWMGTSRTIYNGLMLEYNIAKIGQDVKSKLSTLMKNWKETKLKKYWTKKILRKENNLIKKQKGIIGLRQSKKNMIKFI